MKFSMLGGHHVQLRHSYLLVLTVTKLGETLPSVCDGGDTGLRADRR